MPEFQCNCGRYLRYSESPRGGRIRCPDCRRVFRIPSATEEFGPVEVTDEGSSASPGRSDAAVDDRRRESNVLSKMGLPLKRHAQPKRDFLQLWMQAFAYPISFNGLSAIVGGAFLFVLVRSMFFPRSVLYIIGMVGISLGLLVYMVDIMERSGAGMVEMPDFSAFMKLVDDVDALIAFAAAAALCWGPVIALAYSRPEENAALVAGAVAVLYSPMAALAATLHRSLLAVSPHVVLPAIWRTAWQYGAALLTFSLMLALGLAVRRSLVGRVTAGQFLADMACLYFAAVGMRVLGIVYFCNAKRLDWFRTVDDDDEPE